MKGRMERTEVTSYRCSVRSAPRAASFPGLAAGPEAGFPGQFAAYFASQRTIAFVPGQLPSEKRYLPSSWHIVPQQCVFPRRSVHRWQN